MYKFITKKTSKLIITHPEMLEMEENIFREISEIFCFPGFASFLQKYKSFLGFGLESSIFRNKKNQSGFFSGKKYKIFSRKIIEYVKIFSLVCSAFIIQ